MSLSKMKLIRMKKGLKQNQVAKLLGVTKSYLSMIENNSVKPTDEILIKLSKIYEVHAKELI